jgi:hypothetical protein
MRRGSVVPALEMVDVALFGRRVHRPVPPPRQDVQVVLSRLDAVVDRLEGVYERLEPLLNPQQARDTGQGSHGDA